MKTACFTALRQIELVDVPEPVLRRPDDVLLQIDRVGICGSDVHYYLEGRIGDQVLQYPATLGHECSGTVLEIGSGVQGLRAGDRVAVDPAFPCGVCDQCRNGRAHTCRRLLFMGSPGQAPGAVAERYVAPAVCCAAIPASMSLDEAMLVEPLSIGLHAVRLSQLAAGTKIAILGAGPIGLSVLLCAKATASCTALVTDLRDERLAVAARCGADAVLNPRQNDVVAAITRAEPHGLDMVFECSGDPACLEQGQSLLRPGGALILVGIPPVDAVAFDPHRMRRFELRFQAVRRQNNCVVPVVRLIADQRLDPSPLLTHRFALSEISAAFELVAGYCDGVIKAVVDLSGK
ncbi:MAG: zinc-dependent alcohol dehydrogenase [Thermoguttaceae bacterium]